MAYSVKAVLL